METCQRRFCLAAEQHDIGWMDWEVDPTFNTETGRPHLFREIGASTHAPMWTRGVQRAVGAWGIHVALLISRHGGVIYRRYTDRHRVSDADAAAAQNYLNIKSSNRDRRGRDRSDWTLPRWISRQPFSLSPTRYRWRYAAN